MRKRRLQFADHWIRAEYQSVSKLVLWEVDGSVRVGGSNITTESVYQITQIEYNEIKHRNLRISYL